MAGISPARAQAFRILLQMEGGRGHSDTLLRGREVSALPPLDRNLATALVLGTLRWQIELDQRIRPLLKHPNAKLDAEVRIALRLGVFQLMHMERIPARAAIDESVELTKRAGHKFASGLVNAVLRKVAQSHVNSENDCLNAYPAWMLERWTDFYGRKEAFSICRSGQEQPSISVRLTGDTIKPELATEGIELGPGEFLQVAWRVIAGDVTKAAALREGRLRIQDEGSQLIAELIPRGNSILDSCAAPGGKTLILAERNPEMIIVACEASPQRLAQLQKRLQPLGERAQCRLADATNFGEENAFDVVLADVPCSGTGTLGRNPEIRHRLQPGDLPRHAERQKALLQSALRVVRPGGYVLYSTCSLEPEENEQVVDAILSESKNTQIAPFQQRIEKLSAERILTTAGADRLLESITSQGFLRLLPGAFQTDGFFAALLRKKPSSPPTLP
ncbi:MAG TPA: transcription antitermination factor NusB [Terracidiphilus sp.]|jgi:16S rRNA (cytosine967-C5)-methyltransferase